MRTEISSAGVEKREGEGSALALKGSHDVGLHWRMP